MFEATYIGLLCNQPYATDRLAFPLKMRIPAGRCDVHLAFFDECRKDVLLRRSVNLKSLKR